MSYNPEDHVIATRQVLAGWVVCLGIVGLALGLMPTDRPPPATATAAQQAAIAANHDPASGAHIPRFVECCTGLGKHRLANSETKPGSPTPSIASCA